MDDQWLIITRAARLDIWNLGPVPADQIEGLSLRARIVADISPGHDEPGLVCVSPGEPHAQTMRRAVVRERAELEAVTPAQVESYRNAQASAAQSRRIDSLANQVASMPTEDQEALRGRLGWRPKGNGNGLTKD